MRQHHYKRTKPAPELDVTTFMNLMVALVPFLLITAVFSRITIVELDLPSSNSSGAVSEPGFRPEVIVRESGMEITNGRQVIAALPKVDGEYDIATLADYMSLAETRVSRRERRIRAFGAADSLRLSGPSDGCR